jgi:hypothetical protein
MCYLLFYFSFVLSLVLTCYRLLLLSNTVIEELNYELDESLGSPA